MFLYLYMSSDHYFGKCFHRTLSFHYALCDAHNCFIKNCLSKIYFFDHASVMLLCNRAFIPKNYFHNLNTYLLNLWTIFLIISHICSFQTMWNICNYIHKRFWVQCSNHVSCTIYINTSVFSLSMSKSYRKYLFPDC